MPDFPIIDTHVHLWDTNQLSYSWLANNPEINRPFLLADFDQARADIAVEKIVFVEAAADTEHAFDEAAWVAGLNRTDSRIAGIVAAASLEKGAAVKADLEQLTAYPKVKGVRRILQGEADPAYCLQPNFVAGVQALDDFDLSFDICIYHIQLASVIELVKQCPFIPFILDHIGKPDIKNQVFEPWKRELKALAELPNVWCKLSGMVTEADHDHWTAADLQPYIDHVIECFGFERVMFGGDWPVATLATEYPRWVETLSQAVSGASETELKKLFHDNATAFYRLG
jgi:L-fuconolactonase